MNNYKYNTSIFAFTLAVVGLLIYLYGFFPLNQTIRQALERNDNFGKNPKYVDKLAIVVIDSLRYDFVTSNQQEFMMPYTTFSILNNESCLIRMKADSPTVTMPRIKAMTSGTVSNYIDVVLNIMSSSFEEDNFLNKAVLKGLKVVFYGDDTWLKLYPKTFFRSEGTSSFFVMDYKEVDDNVTRHIDSELEKNDWDIIILHYLGLDHIGHIEGPTSPLVPAKLKEMDDVIKKISTYFKSFKSKYGFETMLLVTSDHGMKDSGGHGGITYAEVTVPLISVGNPCKKLTGWPKHNMALQVDLAPTLCTLLGLSLPLKSVGKIIPSILHWMTDEEIMKSLEANKLHLLGLSGMKLDYSDINLAYSFQNAEEIPTPKHIVNAKYYEDLSQISNNIIKSGSEFKYFYLLCGTIILWSSLIFLLYQLLLKFQKPKLLSQWFLILGTFLHSVSLVSSSFIEEEHQTWYFLWLTFCTIIIVEIMHQKRVTFLRKLRNCSTWIIICFTHRILRKLNQTGDKWSFLPDVKKYLNSTEGQPWLIALFIISLSLIFMLAAVQHFSVWQSLYFGLSLLCAFFYRLNTGSIQLNFLEYFPRSRGSTEVMFFWLFAAMYIALTFHCRTQKYFMWLLFASLFLKPYNTVVLPVQIFMSKAIHRYYNKENILWNNVAHNWIGYLFYFYQGNGNSLANIDVTPAFIGIQTYDPVYSIVMVSCHTFSGLILSFILSPKFIIIWAVLRLIPLTLYCTFLMFQLHHLFIWSIFSPKLLYESCKTFLLLILLIIRHFSSSKLFKN